MRLDALLRAHSYMRVERPPELWEADTDDIGLIPLLGEMIAASLRYETLDLAELTLNASNVQVQHDEGGPRPGEYVALTVSGPVAREPDAVWMPGHPPASGLLFRTNERLLAARARYAYIRNLNVRGSITVFLSRRI